MELNEFEKLNDKIALMKADIERLGEAITYINGVDIRINSNDADHVIKLNEPESKRVRSLLIDMKIEQEKKLIELVGKIRFNGVNQIDIEELIKEGSAQ